MVKIGYVPLVLACSAMALASCGVGKSTVKETPSQDGVTSVSSEKDVPVVVSGQASEF